MRTCKEVAARLSVGLEEPLPLGERMTLRLHLMMCGYCTRYYDQIRALRDLAQGYDAADVPPLGEKHALSPGAQERISQALSKARSDSAD